MPIRSANGTIIYAMASFSDITERRMVQEALRLRAEHEEVIQAQAASLQELSTPLLTITDGVVVMPLIGAIDSARAQQVMEALLSGVAEQHATTAILDITGVTVVDTQVADVLVRAAQATQLLSAQAIITGIRPEIAQTLIGLGVDLSSITTRSTLQSGILCAIGQGGQRIVANATRQQKTNMNEILTRTRQFRPSDLCRSVRMSRLIPGWHLPKKLADYCAAASASFPPPLSRTAPQS